MFSTFFKFLAKLPILFSTLLVVTSHNAKATFIDFNDLNPVYNEEFPCWCDNPLSDEYLDKGVLIDGAWVNGGNGQNVMLTSNWASIQFVDTLPNFISMNVTSHYGDSISLAFYGVDGLLFSHYTSGWRGWEENSTPVIPNEFVSFNTPQGIEYITIQGFYNMRIGAAIDNLTFESRMVTEPSLLFLLLTGLIGLHWKRKKYFTRHQENY